MKKILGLDLGTNSIGWAVVNEAECNEEQSSIVKLGVRVIKYDNFVSTDTGKESKDPEKDFIGGKGISPNAGRTKSRSARRNLQRFKLRRKNLIDCLIKNKIITSKTVLLEEGNKTTFETYKLRAKSATEKVELNEFARILLQINKKRGYKSSRKAKGTEEGQLIDGMEVAMRLYNENITAGELSYQLLKDGKKLLPDFYRSDLQDEFNRIWEFQKQYYSEILTDKLKEDIQNKNETQTWAICKDPFNIVGIKRNGKAAEQKIENYKWRTEAIAKQIGLEELAIVLQKINGQLNKSSKHLGKISDRSKELYFNKQTVGQYQMSKLAENPNYSLKNQVFYRQDYLDEFETIWEKQATFHKELTPELKKEIRDIVIFYQRPLKSQKGLISFCELESREIKLTVDGKEKTKITGSRVCPKSSPLFQEFKIWQILNNIEVKGKIIVAENNQLDLFGEVENTELKTGKRFLDEEEKQILFNELSIKQKISKAEALKLLFENPKELDLNYKDIEGNRTQAELYKAYAKIIEVTGHGEYDFAKMEAEKAKKLVFEIFTGLGFNTDILEFDACKEKGTNEKQDEFRQQAQYKLWHLLYSFEGDNSKTGNENLIQKLCDTYGFNKESATILANVSFQDDYGSLSTKAMRKIIPFLKDGNTYSLACEYAGYNHSKKSLTKEQIDNKVLKDALEILPKNSLRNPVVEKILNQMVNVVNAVISEYGKPDEIRIELARELKKNAKEREESITAIKKNTTENDNIRKLIKKEFGFTHVSKNDVIRYKLYEELAKNGYKTLYSNVQLKREHIFSKKYDIEHIIPQSRLFDDSFSNKTLELRDINIEKGGRTARDFVSEKYGDAGLQEYLKKLDKLYKDGVISKSKYTKLTKKESEIPDNFIERDLRDTQYIAKKAKEMLEDVVKYVIPTTGSITDRLREDWQLVNVMQELNWDKYDKQGLTEIIKGRDGQEVRRIKNWTKRNDHRHHAMDALTIAFTKHAYIQYLNNLSARVGRDKIDSALHSDKDKEKAQSIYAIESKYLKRDDKNKLRFISPIPIEQFRKEAKEQLENTLISIKAKNKVVTKNINKTKKKGNFNRKEQLTPRGQLHNETIYGKIKQYVTKEETVGAKFNEEKILTIASPIYRELLLERLRQNGNDPKKAFTGKNSLEKNPIYLNDAKTDKIPTKIKTVVFEEVYTIRKAVAPDLSIDKVIDANVKRILKERLVEFNNDPKKAFTNLDENPIWLNKEKGIAIKRVTIKGVSNAISLHEKQDLYGNPILDENGEKQGVDFVNTGNNHHVAIYSDEKGNLQDVMVSFFKATTRASLGYPIIDKEYKKDEGWKFLFTMKQNEYFVFPRYEISVNDSGEEIENLVFDPKDIDLLNPENYALISPNLFRVQKISTKNYVFRHHLETTIDINIKTLTWNDFRSSKGLDQIVKVRINHLGQIISVGEY